MRLLHAKTLDLKESYTEMLPRYAILSHTWGVEEVSFQELQSSSAKTKAGYAKTRGCAGKATADGLEYIWVDTCCIDKTSSAELSEAINSMYVWYPRAAVCYTYMVDVNANDSGEVDSSGLAKSR